MTLTPKQELSYLNTAKLKIYEAMAAGASVVKSIEIRGRVVTHTDLQKELDSIDARIAIISQRSSGTQHKSGRTRARIGF